MATYTHFEATPPGDTGIGIVFPWKSVMGSSYNATFNTITITNNDGSLTHAHGSFNVVNNNVLSGTITSLDHTNSDGTVMYEAVTGASVDALQFLGAAPADKLATVFTGPDTLNGYSGDDTLDGYGGADHMAGGAGNDNYYVDSVLDVVTEGANQGSDTVTTSLSTYTLSANVESLYFTSTGNHTGYGNNLDNYITSGDGNNSTFYGYGGNDTFEEYGSTGTFVGGTGNDYYYVHAGDTVVEQANEGFDTVESYIANYVLPANVEKLIVETTNSSDYGNALDNTIVINGGTATTVYGLDGNDTLISSGGSDTLVGGNGNDKLYASGGHDTMTGGSGDDTFVVAGGGNHEITDFSIPGVHDRIDLGEFKPGGPQFGQNIFHNFADVLAHSFQNGANTIIDLGAGNTLTLDNVQKSALSADDFVWGQTPQDFKGDSVSDILWHNDNGADSVWDNGQVNGAHVIAQPGAVSAAWQIAGSGDFDGNGSADVLWHNANGAVSVWDNGDINQAHIISGPGAVSSAWHIAGVADFDGNGQSDILWHNDNGATSIWNNGDINYASLIAKPGDVPAGWHIASTGDFDGNGQHDILWQNDNGAVSIWDNGNINQAHIIANPGDVASSWHIAGTGDFDGNGHDDILWQNDNGAVSIWDNGNINQAHVIATPGAVDSSWHIAGVGDYDGNRQSDILWHNDNGTVSVWDNGQISNAHAIGVVDPSWHIV